MKKEYVKPEIMYVLGENILGEVITPGSPTDVFDSNSGNFELDEEVGDKPASFSLWDTNEN